MIILPELIEEEGYLNLGEMSIERVRRLLVKLDSDRRTGTDYFSNKFVGKIEPLFSGLPKPMEWQSFLLNDLPLITTIDAEVKAVAIEHKLNKSQTKALAEVKKASPHTFQRLVTQGAQPYEDIGHSAHVAR